MAEIRLRGGEIDGLSLHYITEGRRGPVVILVHGLGGFAESWRHNLRHLAAGATVYALDLPGFGNSAKPRARYTLRYLARAVQGFVETLGLGRASLVGHSLGAAVAVTYALTHPLRVERLALLGPLVPGFAYRPSWLFRLAALHGVGEALLLCRSSWMYKAALARCFHASVREEVDYLVDFAYAARTGLDARAAYLATLRHAGADFAERAGDYRRAIASLEAPVLVIHGRQDRVVPTAHVVSVVEGMSQAAARWVDECGHFPQIEHPLAVNGWLTEFLVGRPAPR